MAYAELVDGELTVRADWREKDLASQVPGLNYRSRDDRWHGPLSWGTCVTLQGVFDGRLEIGPALQYWGTEERRWVDAAMFWRDQDISVDLCTATSDDPFCRLYEFQRVGSTFLNLVPDGALLCDEMGTGKTPQALVALSGHDSLGQSTSTWLPALIICPNSVKQHWANEAVTWCPDAVPYVIGGGAAARRKQLQEVAEDPRALVIVNYEAVKLHSRLAPYGSIRLIRCVECGGPDDSVTPARCHKHPKELNQIEWRTVIVDEAHRMKDPKSQQTRACWAVMHQPSVTHRWALTGTPIANDVGDLWSILHGVAPRDFPTRTEWIERFALLSWNRYAALDIVGVKPETRSEFDTIIMPRFRRMLKAQVLPNLPPKVRVVREAPMTTKQAKAYREMEKDMIAILESGDAVLSKTNLTKAIRLLQFSSTYAQVDVDNTLIMTEPSPKLDVMEEVLDELGERQVAICALSRQLIELAAARLDKRQESYRLLTGAVPQTLRQPGIDDFQAGRARVMLFTIQAGGVGVNLTAADTIVFLQRSWSMLENRQAEDRVHRVGSERHESITIVDVVAPETVEVRQIQRLRAKADQLEELVRDRDRLAAAGIDYEQLIANELGDRLL